MKPSVYDASVVGHANEDLARRIEDSILNNRLLVIEEFLRGERVALYNDKLLGEYVKLLSKGSNDVIRGFFEALTDRGKRAPSNNLSRQLNNKAHEVNWPTHDRHLLAAALIASKSEVIVTERRLAECSKACKRVLGVSVLHV